MSSTAPDGSALPGRGASVTGAVPAVPAVPTVPPVVTGRDCTSWIRCPSITHSADVTSAGL
ncbi:hypothetical protein [Parafrankia discariae]|uniref:hypothetical protein n=1 Tax=Parafrankia discariae TaxID=365528 RepID=UPI0004774326|nr:hypothetical protein [Parafrankia discariae]